MPQVKELNLQYITNPSGEKTAVILPMVEFQELVEDLADLAAVAERRAEPTVSHDQLVEDYFEFEDDAIRIKGHRIWLEHVLEYYLSGYAPEEIAREFPGLSLDKVYAAITYYLTHRAEVDAYLIRVDEQKERDYQESLKRPSPLRDRLRALYAQRIEQAMQAAPITHAA